MKVLLCIDGSPTAEKTFDWYIENVHKDQNEVHICHEMEQPKLPNSSYSMIGTVFPAEEIQAIVHEHQRKWKALRDHYKDKCSKVESLNFKIHFEQIGKKPGVGIVKKAEELGVDLIVIGTRGHGTIKRTLLGSVSDYVLHHAKIPITIIH